MNGIEIYLTQIRRKLIQLIESMSNDMMALPLLPIPLLARTARHLKLTLTPLEHQALWNPYQTPTGGFRTPSDDDLHFLNSLPEYVLARCPICTAPYLERMDTHTLHKWAPKTWETLGTMAWGEHQHIGCDHFVRVQSFINLNGFVPTELRYYSGGSEVPYVMPIFLSDEPPSYVVMHSLPICRLEDGRFVPRYSLFVLTYYSERRAVLIDRRLKDAERGANDPDFYLPMMYPWGEAIAHTSEGTWDLTRWVVRGKLWWLDLDRDDLPLKSGPVEAFPYGNITGMRRGFTYRDGEIFIE